jgi:arylsulfatase A-like enzyme
MTSRAIAPVSSIASRSLCRSWRSAEYLPTVHGFDEFFGNLYHVNAEEDPEDFNYPRDPKFAEMFGPRGVLRCKASDRDDPTEEPRWGRVGKQTIEDTGPLTRKRMETIDDETSEVAADFVKRQVAAKKPFFCWFNSTRTDWNVRARAAFRRAFGHRLLRTLRVGFRARLKSA